MKTNGLSMRLKKSDCKFNVLDVEKRLIRWKGDGDLCYSNYTSASLKITNDNWEIMCYTQKQ